MSAGLAGFIFPAAGSPAVSASASGSAQRFVIKAITSAGPLGVAPRKKIREVENSPGDVNI